MNQEEFSSGEVANISKKELGVRYEYFIKRIADQEEVCIVKNKDGSYYIETNGDILSFHLWNAIEFAQSFLEDKELDLVPTVVDFDVLGQDIYPLIKEKILVFSIMPVKEVVGYMVGIEKFSKDLQDYIEEWYG